jgi:hypothetical protein
MGTQVDLPSRTTHSWSEGQKLTSHTAEGSEEAMGLVRAAGMRRRRKDVSLRGIMVVI